MNAGGITIRSLVSRALFELFGTSVPQSASGRESSKGGNQPAATSVLDRDRGGSPPPSSGLSGEQLAVTGIKNLGNTCFLNAVLQSLASFHVFRQYLEDLYNYDLHERERERESNKVCYGAESVLSTKPLESTVFTCELLQLMKDLEPQVPPAPRVTPIIPTKLRKLLRDRVDTFGKEDQQDAQELFQMVMRLVGEEAALCLKNRSTSSTSRTSAPGIGITGGFADLMDTASKSLPENPLLGSLMYLRHCRGCQQKSGRLERFVDLSLTLPEARNPHVVGPGVPSPPVNLDKILEDFTREQLVEDVECPKCAMRSAMEVHETHDEESESEEEEGEDSDDEEVVVPPQRVRADMRMLLATPPKTLCLHFPRRHRSPSGSEMKLKQRVIFPAHLNVARFCYAGGCHTDSIGVPTAFQMKSMLANSL
ncbi:unnamed protein product, partial [Ectocarpus sp. 12 AP-2014]